MRARDHLANERTFLAWMRTGLAVVVFGFAIGRFAIEGLRLDSFWLGSYRVPQLASLVGVLVAVVGVAWAKRRASSPAAR